MPYPTAVYSTSKPQNISAPSKRSSTTRTGIYHQNASSQKSDQHRESIPLSHNLQAIQVFRILQANRIKEKEKKRQKERRAGKYNPTSKLLNLSDPVPMNRLLVNATTFLPLASYSSHSVHHLLPHDELSSHPPI